MTWLSGWQYRKSVPVSIPGNGGNDSNTVVLLTGAGANNSTAIVDTAFGGPKPWTARGNACVKTDQSKFGGSSLYFDGVNDWVDTPDHEDFNFGSGNFTIDGWFRLASLPPDGSGAVFFWQGGSWTNYISVHLYRSGTNISLQFVHYTNGNLDFSAGGIFTITTGTWYHFAAVRNGNEQKAYLNGVAGSNVGSFSGSCQNFTSLCYVGCAFDQSWDFHGWIDELRVSKGVARWTADFTPPDQPYSINSTTNYQMRVLVGQSSGASGADVHCHGNVRDDFNDLRFTRSDGTTLLDYWIESITGTSPNRLATVWVELNEVGVNPATYYMYYGKSDASAYSNIKTTFVLGDDFNDNVIDYDIWTNYSAGGATGTREEINNEILRIVHNSGTGWIAFGLSNTQIPSQQVSFELFARWRGNLPGTTGMVRACVWLGGITGSWQCHLGRDSSTLFRGIHDGNTNIISEPYSNNTYVVYRILKNGSVATVWLDGTQKWQGNPVVSGLNGLTVGINVNNNPSPPTGDYDYVYARKFTDPEPAWGSWGSQEEEQQPQGGVIMVLFD